MTPLLREIDIDRIILNLIYTANPPVTMEDVVPHVKSDVLLKIVDGIVHIPPILVEIGQPDIIIELTVILIFCPITFDEIFAGILVFWFVGQQLFQNRNGVVPIFILFEYRKK